MYFDEELNATERESVEAHLATCETCHAEAQALRELFTALDKVADVPAPNLVPGVLAHIQPWHRPRHRPAALRWLVPAFQGVAATALLAWGWVRLVSRMSTIARALPIDELGALWANITRWAMSQWALLSTWPGTFLSAFQNWSAKFSTAPRFTLPQIALLGITAAALWLIGNALILRRATLNGKKTR